MKVYIYDLIPAVEALQLGPTWNGWATPAFDEASAKLVVDAWNKAHPGVCSVLPATAPAGVSDDEWSEIVNPETGMVDKPCAFFRESERSFVFYDPDMDEFDEFPPIMIDGVEAWEIGARCWTWDREDI